MTPAERIFAAALLDGSRPVPAGLRDGAGGPAGRRFGVYRNNVAASLTEAMHLAFPVIARLLGKQNMDGLAGLFLRAHPPSSPLMMHYGAAFPDFLSAMEQLSHLAYLPDVARLELALRRSYHAADADPVAPADLAEANPDRLADSRIVFAPAMEIVRSRWPIHDIWRFNTETGAPRPRGVAQDVLITRPQFDPEPQPLPDGGADWIGAMQGGLTVGDALDSAQRRTPGFDPAPTLALLLGGGAVVSLESTG
ncbi:MAG: putative DNA-binding domain-containing protein [Rhodobacteraceae bacterium]|nr:putative DNA-binding domain-containing protein [Paracoccaceae bacterium]